MTHHTPRHLRYSKANGEKYRALLEDDLSPFYHTTYKDVFIYAAAYGFRNGLRQKLNKAQPNIPLSVLSEQEKWLLKAIALAESKSLQILNNEKEMYQIAEEYANGALEPIYLEVLGGKAGEPYKRMMQDLFEVFDLAQK